MRWLFYRRFVHKQHCSTTSVWLIELFLKKNYVQYADNTGLKPFDKSFISHGKHLARMQHFGLDWIYVRWTHQHLIVRRSAVYKVSLALPANLKKSAHLTTLKNCQKLNASRVHGFASLRALHQEQWSPYLIATPPQGWPWDFHIILLTEQWPARDVPQLDRCIASGT